MSTPDEQPATTTMPGPPMPGESDRAEVEVAHEALIRHWKRLQTWLGEDRVGLQLRQEISDSAQAWAEHDRNNDYLAHLGSRLSEVEALQRAGRLPLNELESSYVAACMASREREVAEAQNRLVAEERAAVERKAASRFRWLSAVLAVLVAVASVASWIAYDSRQEARQQALVSQVSDIAGTSINLVAGDQQDQLAALLAVEASYMGEDAGIDGDVGTALQASIGAPHFSWLLDSKTQSQIASFAFDPVVEQLAAGHMNGAVELWDLALATPQFRTLTPAFTGGDGWVSSVAFSPDGRYLAAAAYHGAIQIWDLNGASPDEAVTHLQLPRAIYSLTFGSSPSAGVFLLAAACTEQTCASNSLGDADAIDENGSVGTVTVTQWFANSGFDADAAKSFELPGNRIYSTAVSGNGRWLAAGGCKRFPQPPLPEPTAENGCEAGFLYIRDLEDENAPLISTDQGAGAIMAVAFSPGASDRPQLAAGGDDRIIRIWQPGYGETDPVAAAALTGHNEEIRSLAFSPTSSFLVSGGHDGAVSLWDLSTRQPVVQELGDSSSWVRAVAFDASGNRMVSTHGNGQIRLWEIIPEHPLSEPGILPGHSGYIRSLAFGPNPDAPMLASAAEDGLVRIWSLENGHIAVRTVEVRPGSVGVKLSALSFSSDGSMLAVADERGALWAFDPVDSSSVPVRIGTHQSGPLMAVFSPVHPIVAAGGRSGLVMLWDATSGEPTPLGDSLDAGGQQIWTLAFNRDGTVLAAGTANGTIYRWRVAADGRTTEPMPSLMLDGVAIRALTFGPGNELVTGDSAGSICFWGSGEPSLPNACPKRVYGHTGDVRSLAFSPAGDLLASGGIDQAVKLWNPNNLDEAPVVIPSIMEWVRGLAFSPDGHTLASPSTQGTIRLILPYSDDLVDRACARVGRDMTPEEWSAYMQNEPYRATCTGHESNGDQGLSPPGIVIRNQAATLPVMTLQGRRRLPKSLPHRRIAPPAA